MARLVLHSAPKVKIVAARAAAVLAVAGVTFASGSPRAPRHAGALPSALEIDEKNLSGDEIFGPGPEATHPSRERITFRLHLVVADTGPAQVRLRYAAARAPEERIEVRLNDRAVAFVPPSSDAWREGIEVQIPPGLARDGTLEVAFVDALDGIGEEPLAWNVGVPELVVEPLPSCGAAECLEQAERLHALGLREYEAKGLGPRNLFDAWTHLHRASLLLEAVGDTRDALERTRALRDRTRTELDDRCTTLRFTVMRSVALEDRARASRAAREMLGVFPEGTHPCHDGGKRMLALLDEKEVP